MLPKGVMLVPGPLRDVASSLANPNNSLGALSFPIDFVQYDGDAPGCPR